MKILKNKKILYIGIPVIVVILAFIICLCLNKYSLELSITDGTVINLEYGDNEGLPEVTALYKGTIFNRDGTEVEVSADKEVDLDKLGTYVVTYSAEYKDKKSESKVTIIVEDTIAPVIELVSDPEYFTSPIATYEEEGYTATDNYDGDITDAVVREEKDGKVIYTATDSSGNKTVVERVIVYKDVVPPVITLNEGADITVVLGTDYVEPGFVATDDCDGDITQNVEIEGSVNGNEVGMYTLTYRVKDSYDNICEITRNVKVADTVAPTIKLQGSYSMYIKLGETYSEPGYTATDNIDGDIASQVAVSGSVDTSKIGIYAVTYQVSDSSGNTAKIKRTVYVYEKQAESVAINPGNKVVYLTFDDGPGAYTEKLLNILDKYGVKVTFFVTNQHPGYRNLIGEAHRRGHTIALHTCTHKFSIYASEETYYDDLKKINDICVAQTGVQPKIVRFPGGTSNTASRQYSKGIMTKLANGLSYHGYLYCDWNVSSGDAGGANTASKVASNVISGIKSHNVSVVLQHDTKSYSVDAVEQILAWGLANGYTFLPMTENTPMVHHKPNN